MSYDTDIFNTAGSSALAPSSGYDTDIFNAPTRTDPTASTARPPAEDPGVLNAALIGAGRKSDQIIKGIQQAYYRATGNTDKEDALSQQVAENNRQYQPLQQMHPWATGLGESVPSALAASLTRGGGAISSSLASAVPGLLGYGSAGERAGSGLLDFAGNMAGLGAGSLANRLIYPAGAGAARVGADTMGAAERLGMDVTPAMRSQSPSLLNFENKLRRYPGSAGIMAATDDANRAAIQSAAARSIGETGTDLGETVLGSAANRIGGEFNRLQGVTKPDVGGGNFFSTLTKLDSDNAARGAFRNSAIDDLVNRGLDLASSNNLTGDAYKQIRTQLSSQKDAAFKGGDATLGQAYKDVIGGLDDAAKSSLSGADASAWDTARAQYRNLKTLTTGNTTEAGIVSPARVASVVNRNAPGQLPLGRLTGDLPDIARVGQGFKSALNPNSGVLASGYVPELKTPLNYMMAATYMSPAVRGYMTRGLLGGDVLGDAGRRMLRRGGGLLGITAANNIYGQ